MASLWHRAMVYLGLQDDDEYSYDDDDGYGNARPGPSRHDVSGSGDATNDLEYGYDDEYGASSHVGLAGPGQPGPGQPGPGQRGPGQPRRPEYSEVSPRGYGAEPHEVRQLREREGLAVRPGGGAYAGYGEPNVRALPRDEPPSGISMSRAAVVRAVPTTAGKVHVVEPGGFNDAQEIGDRVKSNQAVILNLQSSPRELQRRLIDFSSGLAYAVGGSMSRVADSVFLLAPTNVELSEEEKERLEARGLYRRS